jgi:peptidoglycan/LPS O-acetylase OafA/YrhL
MGRRYLTLDGLRGIAALAVYFYHVQVNRHHGGLFGHAYLAVDFFFLLSGFVIGAAYERRLETMGWLGFARVRLARLYPLIAIGIFIGAGAFAMLGATFSIPLVVLAQLLFIPALASAEPFPLNGVQWSLFFELSANFTHAALRRWLTTPILIGILALSLVALLWTNAVVGSLNVGFNRENFLWGFPRVAFSYTAGLLMWRAYKAGRLPRVQTPYLIPAGALLLCLATPLPQALDFAFAVIAFPAILTTAIEARIPERLAPVAKFTGDLSYPLYAIHQPLLQLAAVMVPLLSSSWARAAGWAAVAITVPILAYAAQRLADEPIRRRLAVG